MNNIFYPYRVFLRSGSAFQAYRSEKDEIELWSSIRKLRDNNKRRILSCLLGLIRKEKPEVVFTYFAFDRNKTTIDGVLDPFSIIGIDRALGATPVDLEERRRLLKEQEDKTSRIRTKPRSTAIDITPKG